MDFGALSIGVLCAELWSLGSERKNLRDVDTARGLDLNELLARDCRELSWLFRVLPDSNMDFDLWRRRYEDGADATSSSGV